MDFLRPSLIFDLDNTLVECGLYYNNAKDELVAVQSKRTGIAPPIIREIFTAIDLQSARLEGGFSRDRFPRSFSAATAVLDIILGRDIDASEMARMHAVGDEVFRAPYPMYPGVEDALSWYSSGGWQLILCSKGQTDVQMRKIMLNQLPRFFDLQRLYITLVKSADYLQHLLREQQVDVANSWYIGDSMRDDMGPALEVGLQTAHVLTDGSKWGYENIEHRPTVSVAGVPDLMTIIPRVPENARKASHVT